MILSQNSNRHLPLNKLVQINRRVTFEEGLDFKLSFIRKYLGSDFWGSLYFFRFREIACYEALSDSGKSFAERHKSEILE